MSDERPSVPPPTQEAAPVAEEIPVEVSEDAAEAAAPAGSAGDDLPADAGDIDDANDLQAFHFKRLMRKPVTRIVGGVLAVGGGAIGAIVLGPLIGAAIAAGIALLTVLVVFALADSAAEDAFFKVYADQRGLTLVGDGHLGPKTPLLRKGDERKAEQIMRGELAEDCKGKIALYTYTDVYYDKNGRHENHYHFTVAMTELPETATLVPELLCNRKFGLKAFEKLEDAFRSNERVKLESVDLDERFEIFCDENQDQNFLRQLFSPSFIVWMAEEAPEKFAFELEDGILACNVKGHKKSASELDTMRTATAAVARRLREETAE
jgi:hypothetical protein